MLGGIGDSRGNDMVMGGVLGEGGIFWGKYKKWVEKVCF